MTRGFKFTCHVRRKHRTTVKRGNERDLIYCGAAEGSYHNVTRD